MTSYAYVGGAGTYYIGKITAPDPTNIELAYSNENQTRLYGTIRLPNGTERVQSDY